MDIFPIGSWNGRVSERTASGVAAMVIAMFASVCRMKNREVWSTARRATSRSRSARYPNVVPKPCARCTPDVGRYSTHSSSSPSSPSTRFRSVWRSLSQRDHLGTIAAAASTSAASVAPHLRAGLWLAMRRGASDQGRQRARSCDHNSASGDGEGSENADVAKSVSK